MRGLRGEQAGLNWQAVRPGAAAQSQRRDSPSAAVMSSRATSKPWYASSAAGATFGMLRARVSVCQCERQQAVSVSEQAAAYAAKRGEAWRAEARARV